MEVSIEALQAYLRHSAQKQYQAVPVPPFTLFFNASDDFKFYNYAIPDEPVSGDLHEALHRLQGEFIAVGRQPRLEYLEEFAPGLGKALEAAGYTLAGRQQFMLCRLEDFQPVREVPGLEFDPLDTGASAANIREFILTQRKGFNSEQIPSISTDDIAAFQFTLENNTGVLARLDGRPAAAAMLAEPYQGISEVTGITTQTEQRNKGIGTAITAEAARIAFERGVKVLCLTAEDEQAGRIYERVGFKPFATSLSYERDINQ